MAQHLNQLQRVKLKILNSATPLDYLGERILCDGDNQFLVNPDSIQQFSRGSFCCISELFCLFNIALRLGSSLQIGTEFFATLEDRDGPICLVCFNDFQAIKAEEFEAVRKFRTKLGYPPNK